MPLRKKKKISNNTTASEEKDNFSYIEAANILHYMQRVIIPKEIDKFLLYVTQEFGSEEITPSVLTAAVFRANIDSIGRVMVIASKHKPELITLDIAIDAIKKSQENRIGVVTAKRNRDDPLVMTLYSICCNQQLITKEYTKTFVNTVQVEEDKRFIENFMDQAFAYLCIDRHIESLTKQEFASMLERSIKRKNTRWQNYEDNRRNGDPNELSI